MLAARDGFHVIGDYATCYVAGFLTKLFLAKAAQGCRCLTLLKDGSDNLNRPYQYFIMLKGYHIPDKRLRHLTVPSEAAFTLVQKLESHFLYIIESTAHHQSICDVLHQTLTFCWSSFLLYGVA